jgi:hypothetical protein
MRTRSANDAPTALLCNLRLQRPLLFENRRSEQIFFSTIPRGEGTAYHIRRGAGGRAGRCHRSTGATRALWHARLPPPARRRPLRGRAACAPRLPHLPTRARSAAGLPSAARNRLCLANQSGATARGAALAHARYGPRPSAGLSLKVGKACRRALIVSQARAISSAVPFLPLYRLRGALARRAAPPLPCGRCWLRADSHGCGPARPASLCSPFLASLSRHACTFIRSVLPCESTR